MGGRRVTQSSGATLHLGLIGAMAQFGSRLPGNHASPQEPFRALLQMIRIRVGDRCFGRSFPGALGLCDAERGEWQEHEQGSAKYTAEPGQDCRCNYVASMEGRLCAVKVKSACKACCRPFRKVERKYRQRRIGSGLPRTLQHGARLASYLYNLQRILRSDCECFEVLCNADPAFCVT